MVDRWELRGLGHLIGKGSNRKLRQVWERRVEGMQERTKVKDRMEGHMWKLMRKKGKILLEATGLTKDGKVFWI